MLNDWLSLLFFSWPAMLVLSVAAGAGVLKIGEQLNVISLSPKVRFHLAFFGAWLWIVAQKLSVLRLLQHHVGGISGFFWMSLLWPKALIAFSQGVDDFTIGVTQLSSK